VTEAAGRIEERLRALGLVLPAPKPPVANYLGTKRSGSLLFVSGRVSALRGLVGADVTLEAAQLAARDTMLLLLAIVKRDIGDLDAIASVEMVRGFVRSAPDFVDQPLVVDGASDLLVALWGEAGRHARTATGVNQLPGGACLQVEMIVRLS
jgi:enamine deaminase RidA (YjgF/YER057c/UK114 family)